MKVGGIRRVIIPPSQGYQNTSQEPIPPNVCIFSLPFQFLFIVHVSNMVLMGIVIVVCESSNTNVKLFPPC